MSEIKNKSRRIYSKVKNSKVVRNFIAVAGSSLSLRPIQLVKEYMVAKYLGPSDYGLLKSIELVTMMNKYGSLGFKSVAAREAGDALGRGDRDYADKLKGYSYAGELILAGILFIVGLCSSVLFSDIRISILIILASFSFLASKINGLFGSEAVINKDFFSLSKIDFISGLITSLLIICLVPFLGIYIVVLMQFMIGVISILLFVKKMGYRLTYEFNTQEILKAAKIGMPITLNVLLLGGIKYFERIIILSILGTVSLGIYSFGLTLSSQLSSLFKLVMKVRAQDIFELLGRREYEKTHKLVVRETILLIAVSILVYPLYYLSTFYLIPLLLPDWVDAVIYAQILYAVVPIQTSIMYIMLVLGSSAVNQQKIMSISRGISIIVLLSLFFIIYLFSDINLFRISVVMILSYLTFSICIFYFYINKFIKKFIQN